MTSPIPIIPAPVSGATASLHQPSGLHPKVDFIDSVNYGDRSVYTWDYFHKYTCVE